MNKAVIFRNSSFLDDEKKELDYFMNFNNSIIEIYDNKLIFKNEKINEFNLFFFEKDHQTITYIGKTPFGNNFRFVKHIDPITLMAIKRQYNAIDAFSIGSENPSGYAIHFYITDESSFQNTKIINVSNEEGLETLLHACNMALTTGLYPHATNISFRIIEFLNNFPDQIPLCDKYNDVSNFLSLIIDNNSITNQSISHFSSKINPLKIVNITFLNKNHRLNNIKDVFKKDIYDCYFAMKKINDNILIPDIFNIFVYYAIDMMITYKKSIQGILPISIVDDIANTVIIIASEISSDFKEQDRIDLLKRVIYNKIYSPDIEIEVQEFMSKLNLN